MTFEMWTWYHYLYILSPFLIMGALYFFLHNKSERTKYIVGVVIGVISLLVLVARNVSIVVRGGFSPQIIPLQVCHFGNIMVFIALVFKSKTATAIAWTLNLIPAFMSLVIADSLANYANVWDLRAQAYIWGHLFIVVGAIYPVMLNTIKMTLKDFYRGMMVAAGLLFMAIIANTYFNDFLNRNINYFYIYNSNGVPFEPFYNAGRMITIGDWFSLNPVYVILLIVMGVTIMHGMYGLYYVIQKRRQQQTS